MRVLICGDRNWTDVETIFLVMKEYNSNETTVITGGAKGADDIANQLAIKMNMKTEVYKADWNLGKCAGPIRNWEMLTKGKPNVVLAFHDHLEKSKGTVDTISKSRKLNIPVFIYTSKIENKI